MSRFKTELCNNLIELGSCKYGDRCHYAHGAHELRQVSRRHPKYRTEKCKNFELTGKCPFGPRCSYVHPKPDLDSMIEQLTKYVQHTRAPKPDSESENEQPAYAHNLHHTSHSSPIIRTPLSTKALNTNNSINISAAQQSGNNINSNNRTTSSIIQTTNNSQFLIGTQSSFNTHSQQQNNDKSSCNNTINKIGSNSHSHSSLASIFEPDENAFKKPRFIQQSDSSPTSSNASSPTSSLATTNPFNPLTHINNPLSDFLNGTNHHTDDRSPLFPNKQFYTRF